MRAAVVLILLLASSCQHVHPEPPTYRSSSDLGRRCLYACQSAYYRCQAYCGSSNSCQHDCVRSEWSCAQSCPDVKVEFPPVE